MFYPDHTLYCPTGVVHRDWLREKTTGFFVGKRQRMLEKDYQWAVQNGHQPVCCPPHSNWGHSGECECDPCHCNGQPGCVDGHTSAVEVLSPEGCFVEAEAGSDSGIELAGHFAEASEGGQILLVSDERPASGGFAIETAGFHEVSDSCTTGHCPSSSFVNGHGYGYGHGRGHYCPLHRRHCFHGYYGREDCEECPEEECDCPLCCFKRYCQYPFCHFCDCLYSDFPGGNGNGNGGWQREIPPIGFYHLGYPVNPYHFDQRDGRIYAAQGYGHPVGVPLAPNVEHTYQYGWGVPSSRLVPVSRMPGAPGVANPAGVAGPGILPPAYPALLPGGGVALPQ